MFRKHNGCNSQIHIRQSLFIFLLGKFYILTYFNSFLVCDLMVFSNFAALFNLLLIFTQLSHDHEEIICIIIWHGTAVAAANESLESGGLRLVSWWWWSHLDLLLWWPEGFKRRVHLWFEYRKKLAGLASMEWLYHHRWIWFNVCWCKTNNNP